MSFEPWGAIGPATAIKGQLVETCVRNRPEDVTAWIDSSPSGGQDPKISRSDLQAGCDAQAVPSEPGRRFDG